MTQQVAAIIPAGGIGSRMGLEIPKQFYELNSIPVLAHDEKPLPKEEARNGLS